MTPPDADVTDEQASASNVSRPASAGDEVSGDAWVTNPFDRRPVMTTAVRPNLLCPRRQQSSPPPPRRGGNRPTRAGLEYDTAINQLEKRPIEETNPPLSWPSSGPHEAPEAAGTSTSGPSGRGPLTVDQLVKRRRSLKGVAALEVNRVAPGAAVGVAPLATDEIGVQDDVRDALAKLTDGTYGERCRLPISVGRLAAVPYARRCVASPQRDGTGWDQVQGMVGGVVRVLAGEPRGRYEAGS